MTNQIIEQIRARAPQGLNTNIIVIGAPRTGKSWAALRVGEVLSKNFSSKNIAWTIPQFSAILEDNNLKPGDVVIFDEVGVGAKARHWYEDNNSRFIDLMQTYGYRGLVAIMTTPSLDYVDSGARKLFHYLIETTPKHNFKEGWVKTKIRGIKYNPKNGKVYYPALVFNGRKMIMKDRNYHYIFLSLSGKRLVDYVVQVRSDPVKEIKGKSFIMNPNMVYTYRRVPTLILNEKDVEPVSLDYNAAKNRDPQLITDYLLGRINKEKLKALKLGKAQNTLIVITLGIVVLIALMHIYSLYQLNELISSLTAWAANAVKPK